MSLTLSGSKLGTTGNQYIDAKIEWSVVGDVKTNTSKVTASLMYKRNNTGFTTKGTGSFSITIDGTKYTSNKYITITEDAWVTAITATKTVTHDSNGKKTLSISASGSIPDTSLASTSVSFSEALYTIPRASTMDSLTGSSGYFNGELTYRYTPKSSSFYNRCNISLNLDGEYIAVKTINLGKKSASQQTATVTLSESELSTVYKKLPETTKGTLRFTLRTYSDSEYSKQIGDAGYKEITLTIPNDTTTQPTATMTLSPVNSLPSPFSSLYINGRTKVDANFTNGEGKYGAHIVSYKMSVGGKSYGSPYTSGYLTSSGSITVKGTVTDSRGRSRTYEQTITVIPYSDPKILPASGEKGIICARCDSEGNLSESGKYLKIKASRSYSKVTSADVQKNHCTIRYRCVAEGNKFSGDDGWVTLLAGNDTSTNTVNKTISGVVSSTETAYVVQVGVIDDMGASDVVQFIIPTDFVTIDVPEEHKGKRIGLLRYAQDTDEPGIDVGAPIHGGSVDNLTLGDIITASSDLNDFKTPGNYYSPSADISNGITNTPYKDGGFSLIVRELQSQNMIRQELFYGRTNWQRHYSSVTNSWSDWLRYLMTTYEESTAADFVTEIGVWNIDDSDPNLGYWRYRKWKSGAVDMNGLIKVTPVNEGTLGTAGVYYSEVIHIDLPFEVVNFQFTGSSTSYHCFVGNCNSVDGNNKQIRLRLYRFTDFSTLADYDVYVRIVASGKLK